MVGVPCVFPGSDINTARNLSILVQISSSHSPSPARSPNSRLVHTHHEVCGVVPSKRTKSHSQGGNPWDNMGNAHGHSRDTLNLGGIYGTPDLYILWERVYAARWGTDNSTATESRSVNSLFWPLRSECSPYQGLQIFGSKSPTTFVVLLDQQLGVVTQTLREEGFVSSWPERYRWGISQARFLVP